MQQTAHGWNDHDPTHDHEASPKPDGPMTDASGFAMTKFDQLVFELTQARAPDPRCRFVRGVYHILKESGAIRSDMIIQ